MIPTESDPQWALYWSLILHRLRHKALSAPEVVVHWPTAPQPMGLNELYDHVARRDEVGGAFVNWLLDNACFQIPKTEDDPKNGPLRTLPLSIDCPDFFKTLVLDPPWPEQGAGKIKRGADRHYPLLKPRDMPAVIYGSGMLRPTDNAHMYMWVTNNYIEDGLWLMGALGFTYKTNVSWRKRRLAGHKELIKLVKLHQKDPEAALARLHELQDTVQTGIGQYFRGSHELLLFGVRGRGFAAKTEAKNLRSILSALRTAKHSQKPPESYDLIEARSEGPYLEMFARSGRENWTPWGNEAPALSSVSA